MFCDVTIRASNGHMFRAHTCILAASSSVLKAQLLKSQHYVNLPNITERMWQVLLQFMYTGTVEIGDAVEIPSIVEIGKQLQLTELVIVCEDLLRDSSEQHALATREEVFHGEYCKSYMFLKINSSWFTSHNIIIMLYKKVGFKPSRTGYKLQHPL